MAWRWMVSGRGEDGWSVLCVLDNGHWNKLEQIGTKHSIDLLGRKHLLHLWKIAPNRSHQGIPGIPGIPLQCEQLASIWPFWHVFADWWSSQAYPIRSHLFWSLEAVVPRFVSSSALRDYPASTQAELIALCVSNSTNLYGCLFTPNEWIFSTYDSEGLEGSWTVYGVNLICPWRIERAIWSLRSTVEVLADRSGTTTESTVETRIHSGVEHTKSSGNQRCYWVGWSFAFIQIFDRLHQEHNKSWCPQVYYANMSFLIPNFHVPNWATSKILIFWGCRTLKGCFPASAKLNSSCFTCQVMKGPRGHSRNSAQGLS